VNLTEVYISDIVRVIIVFDLSAGPIKSLQSHRFAGVGFYHCWNIWMPSVERFGIRLLARGAVNVNFKGNLGH